MEEDRYKWNELYTLCIEYCKNGKIDNAIQEICNAVKFSRCNLNVHGLSKLVRVIREARCPHSINRSFCQQWDRYMAYILVHCVFPGSLPDSWARIVSELLNELNTSPYDGSDGRVVSTFQTMKRIYDIVADNDYMSLRSVIFRRKLKVPMVHILGESNWTLLHYAAYHGSVECMEFLITEGISPTCVSSDGQTPLHVAAAALRYDALCYLVRLVGPGGALRQDDKGKTPLVSLLDSLRSCKWSRQISSQQLLKSLSLLQPDYWNVGPCSQHPLLDGHLSVFGACVAYTDSFVASKVIHLAHHALQSLVADMHSDAQRTDGHTDKQEARRLLIQCILTDIKSTMLLTIRRKKSRVLSVLLDTFMSYLCPNPLTDSLHQSITITITSAGLTWHAGPAESSADNDYTLHTSAGGVIHTVRFWQQCLLLAAMKGCLRLTALLVAPCAQSFLWASRMDEKAMWGLCEAFLVVPVSRGDVTMVRSILEGFQQHLQIPLWVSSPLRDPCSPSTQREGGAAMKEFLKWSQLPVTLRCAAPLMKVAHHLFSPISIACLVDNPHMLQTLLQFQWSPTNVMDTTHTMTCSFSGIFGGVNPLLCCVLSGSSRCVDVLLEYLGDEVLRWMCNDAGPLRIRPLHALLWILRVRLTKRLFRAEAVVESNAQDDISLCQTIFASYSSLALSHQGTCYLARFILSRTDFGDMSEAREGDISPGDDTAWLGQRLGEFEHYKVDLETALSRQVSLSAPLEDNDDVKNCVRSLSLWWKRISAHVQSVSFVISLKILMQIVQSPQGDLFSAVSGIRTNRHVVSVCRAVVILLEWNQDRLEGERYSDGGASAGGRKDWWSRLSTFTGSDLTLPRDLRYHALHHAGGYCAKKCRLGEFMMSLQGSEVSKAVVDEIRSILPSVDKHTPSNPSLSKQFCSELPIRQSNCYNAVSIGLAIDVMYEWVSLVMAEDRLAERVGRGVVTTCELEDELEAVDHIIHSLARNTKYDHNNAIMSLVGESIFPVEMDMIVCAASAFVSENVYSGVIPVSSVPPCRYNDWNSMSSCGDGDSSVVGSDSSELALRQRQDMPLMSDSWQERSGHGDFIAQTVDISVLCDDIAKILIADGRQSLDCADHFGMTPLICLCSHGLWTAAECLLSQLSQQLDDVSHDNAAGLANALSRSTVLFSGGLLQFDYLFHEHHRGLLNCRRLGDTIWKRLHWSLDDFKKGEVFIVSASAIAVCRRADSFLMKYVQHSPPADVQCLMSWLLVWDNPEMCIDVGFACIGDVVHADFTNSVIVSPQRTLISNHKLSTIIDDICVFGSDCKKRCSGHFLGPERRCIVSARLFVKTVCDNSNLENLKLGTVRAAANINGENPMSSMQLAQQQAMAKHGFFPQYGGPLAGLCLAHGGAYV